MNCTALTSLGQLCNRFFSAALTPCSALTSRVSRAAGAAFHFVAAHANYTRYRVTNYFKSPLQKAEEQFAHHPLRNDILLRVGDVLTSHTTGYHRMLEGEEAQNEQRIREALDAFLCREDLPNLEIRRLGGGTVGIRSFQNDVMRAAKAAWTANAFGLEDWQRGAAILHCIRNHVYTSAFCANPPAYLIDLREEAAFPQREALNFLRSLNLETPQAPNPPEPSDESPPEPLEEPQKSIISKEEWPQRYSGFFQKTEEQFADHPHKDLILAHLQKKLQNGPEIYLGGLAIMNENPEVEAQRRIIEDAEKAFFHREDLEGIKVVWQGGYICSHLKFQKKVMEAVEGMLSKAQSDNSTDIGRIRCYVRNLVYTKKFATDPKTYLLEKGRESDAETFPKNTSLIVLRRIQYN